jgi:hypothetical protein
MVISSHFGTICDGESRRCPHNHYACCLPADAHIWHSDALVCRRLLVQLKRTSPVALNKLSFLVKRVFTARQESLLPWPLTNYRPICAKQALCIQAGAYAQHVRSYRPHEEYSSIILTQKHNFLTRHYVIFFFLSPNTLRSIQFLNKLNFFPLRWLNNVHLVFEMLHMKYITVHTSLQKNRIHRLISSSEIIPEIWKQHICPKNS